MADSKYRRIDREDEVPADSVGPWRWRASRFVLLRTDPSPEGRVYTALGEWALAGALGS